METCNEQQSMMTLIRDSHVNIKGEKKREREMIN